MPLAADAILYNLEQIHAGLAVAPAGADRALCPPHRVGLQRAKCRGAADARRSMSPRVVPIGYVPELTRIERDAAPDIDVLFVGSINERRKRCSSRWSWSSGCV